jgi:hypothetical protein
MPTAMSQDRRASFRGPTWQFVRAHPSLLSYDTRPPFRARFRSRIGGCLTQRTSYASKLTADSAIQLVPVVRGVDIMIATIHGMVPDRHVRDVLMCILQMRGQNWTAIVRSIDSATSVDDLITTLAFHRVPHDVNNGNVCVSIDALQKGLDAGLFTGFDEVWIFSDNPPTFDLGPLPSATSDATDFSSSVPSELTNAIEKTNCVVVLGDGCGLNYATSDKRVQEEIRPSRT